jgi:hypothetical protein
MEEAQIPTPLAQLGRDLNFHSEADSAAILTVLLDHYRNKRKQVVHTRISALLDEDISSPDLVCHMALTTAADWVASSPSRAEALMQYDTFMNQMKEWITRYLISGDEALFPYVSGLQLLLRLCMNSVGSAQVRAPLLWGA